MCRHQTTAKTGICILSRRTNLCTFLHTVFDELLKMSNNCFKHEIFILNTLKYEKKLSTYFWLISYKLDLAI